MLAWLIRRKIDSFAAAYAYDMSYVHEILNVSTQAALAYSRATALGSFRRGVPADIHSLVQLVGVMHEDCGPCVQLGVKIAQQAGASPSNLRAVLAGELEQVPPEYALAVRYARAVLARDSAADEFREALSARYGKLGLVSLAFSLTCARIYPTMKYALGFGHACTRITVDGTVVTPVRAAHSVGVGAAA
jgi:hypothetical protein